MNENIKKHFEIKFLYENKRIMNQNSEIEDIYVQPERSKREDINYFGMKAEIREDGLCYFDDGKIIDPSQLVDDAVL